MRATLKWLILLLVVTGYSFSALAETEDPLFASVHKAGQFKVGVCLAPSYVVASPDGRVTGYAIDIVNLVHKGIDLPPLTPQMLAWEDAHVPALQADTFAGMMKASHFEPSCK
ncbi:hypothetical protein [Bradyrhizobium sp. 76]|uniref:hypothetical protein n=1 Tax=Bradyrhizobium sp. 76 TaxID=2782680 RepID=UPI001FF82D2C|nr:hypothetical protein [Bradyrhizobium sp. 76]MCK1406837.1 hypothetical protein [Bradyrhizobium sp. 76]